jgi:hypothetical protein
MSWLKNLFGRQDAKASERVVPTPMQRPTVSSRATSSSEPTGNPLTDYKRALAYLDSCGPFDERKFREANRIAGGLLSESDVQMMLAQSQMIMPSAGRPGGMDFIKAQVRENLATLIQMAGRMGLR